MPCLNASSHGGNEGNDSDADSEESFESELSQTERRIHQSAIGACYEFDRVNESKSNDNENKLSESDNQSGSPCLNDSSFIGSSPSNQDKQNKNADLGIGTKSMVRKVAGPRSHLSCAVSRAFWPNWVYRMYDSYCLAQKAAGILTLILFVSSALLQQPYLLCLL